MGSPVSPKADAVFGSRTRARVLGYLAASTVPQTGYAISKDLGIGVSKVYGELKKLEAAGVVSSRPDARGARGYLLDDEDLRRFLLRNVRILRADDWFAPERAAERRRRFEEMGRVKVRLPRVPGDASKRPFAEEFRRTPGKDRALDRLKGRSGRRR